MSENGETPVGAGTESQRVASTRWNYSFLLNAGRWSDTTHVVQNFPQLDVQMEDQTMGILRVAATQTSGDVTVKDCAFQLEENARDEWRGFRLLDHGTAVVAGEQAAWIFFSGTDPSSQVDAYTVQYAFLHEGCVYMIMGMAVPDHWQNFRPVFEGALQSFQFTPTNASDELLETLKRTNKWAEAVVGWVFLPAFLLAGLAIVRGWIEDGFWLGSLEGVLLGAFLLVIAYGVSWAITRVRKQSAVPHIRKLVERDGISEMEFRQRLKTDYKNIGDWFFEDINES